MMKEAGLPELLVPFQTKDSVFLSHHSWAGHYYILERTELNPRDSKFTNATHRIPEIASDRNPDILCAAPTLLKQAL